MENGFEWPGLLSALVLTQHPDQHGTQYPILLAVDQKLGEGSFRVRSVGTDRIDRSN